MNKINQDKITPQVLDKIKEVNEEAGYRTYLEVPEMIRIICEVVETNYNVNQRNLMNELAEGIEALEERRNMERKRLDERLGNREPVNPEETFAPHLDEERNMTMAQLTKDYGEIIDKQRKILHDVLKILPIGYEPDHTIENIPALVHSWVERALQAEAYNEEPEELVEGLERYPEDEKEELKFVTISKILVPTERDKEQLLKAFKYLHDHGFIDSEYYAVNTIIHMYQNPDLIEIEK